MNIAEWIDYGVAHGFCSEPVCQTHDMTPMTTDEALDFEDGGDPCISVVRLYEQDGS